MKIADVIIGEIKLDHNSETGDFSVIFVAIQTLTILIHSHQTINAIESMLNSKVISIKKQEYTGQYYDRDISGMSY